MFFYLTALACRKLHRLILPNADFSPLLGELKPSLFVQEVPCRAKRIPVVKCCELTRILRRILRVARWNSRKRTACHPWSDFVGWISLVRNVSAVKERFICHEDRNPSWSRPRRRWGWPVVFERRVFFGVFQSCCALSFRGMRWSWFSERINFLCARISSQIDESISFEEVIFLLASEDLFLRAGFENFEFVRIIRNEMFLVFFFLEWNCCSFSARFSTSQK